MRHCFDSRSMSPCRVRRCLRLIFAGLVLLWCSILILHLAGLSFTAIKYYCIAASTVDGQFQPVEVNKESQLSVYSAFFDPRLPNELKIVAVGKHSVNGGKRDHNWPSQQFSCLLFPNGSNPRLLKNIELTDAHVYNLTSSDVTITPVVSMTAMWWNHIESVEIKCTGFPQIADGNTWFVSIINNSPSCCSQNLLPIIVTRIPKQRELFAMCTQPLHAYFNNTYNLIEMIELNRIFGAQHFYFYNLSVSGPVSKVLDYYKKQNIVTVLSWHIPPGVMLDGEVGQMAALADCQRRVMQRYKYLVYTDLDEVIVPRNRHSWTELDAHVFSKQDASQFVFSNVYFFTNQSDDTRAANDSAVRSFKLLTLLKTVRYVHGLPYNDRSKAIARSECINRHAIHFVDSLLPVDGCRGLKTINVAADIGLLHHYRCCKGSYGLNLPQDRTELTDHYLFDSFRNILIDGVHRAHKSLN